jgi:N-acetylglucosaminyl-diphospho-decaprenol L-rhamnosyltransferase
MSQAPTIAVVVVSFETRTTLLDGLTALERNAGIAIETVVVDNASHDGSAEAVRARFPRVRVVANAQNVGFARACNQGVRETRAPLVLFLNPDATLEPGALAALASLLEARPRVGIAGPRTRSSNGDIQVSTGPDLSLASEWRQRRLVRGVVHRDPHALATAEARHAVEHEPDWVSGACLLARREPLLAVGGFDEGFFLYEEDADLCRRVRAAGWQVLFTPLAEVRHARGLSMARAPQRAHLEYHRSHLRYYRKHRGLPQRAALRLLLAARAGLELLAATVSGDLARLREAMALLQLAVLGPSAT